MTRDFIVGMFAVLVVAGAIFYFYRTSEELPERATFSGVSLKIEYALTPEERERGLSGRESVPEEYGMLFVFPKDDFYGFWMKDTLAPLDIFWLDKEGEVISMALHVATSSYPSVFYPTAPSRYVLETVAGFGEKHEVATGTPLLLKKFPNVSK